jgi:hypothetical protein
VRVNLFPWMTFDVRPVLPEDWVEQVLAVAADARMTTLQPASSTSREEPSSGGVVVHTVDGHEVDRRLPWLTALYRDGFRVRAERFAGRPVSSARDPLYAINLNVQVGGNRYECHVDSNPVGALLYVTDHPKGTGGELVVGHDPEARSLDAVDADCSVIYPVAGHLVLFDARRHPHYVRPLRTPGRSRIAVAMNYYTADSPEDDRPADLSDHLFALDGQTAG